MDLLKRFCCLIVAVGFAHAMIPTQGCADDAFSIPEKLPARDPILQKRIHEWVIEMLRLAESETEVELEDFAEAAKLMNQLVDEHRKAAKMDLLLQQVLLYKTTLLEKANQIDTFMANSFVMIFLMDGCPEKRYKLKEIEPHELLHALAPFMKIEDKEQFKEVHKTISYRLEDNILSEMESFLRKEKQNPPGALITFLFEMAPAEMVQMLLRIYDDGNNRRRDKNSELYGKTVHLGENAITGNLLKQKFGVLKEDEVEPEALGHLKKLAGHEAWWVRLYAAEIMRQQPEFRDSRAVKRLKDDKHPLVKRAMRFTNEDAGK